MTPQVPAQAIDDLGRQSRRALEPGVRVLFVAVGVALLVAAGIVARVGTPEARAGAALGLFAVGAAYAVRALVIRRELRRRELVVRRLFARQHPELAERVLRAMALEARAQEDETVGSAELARLHLRRTVERLPGAAARERSARQGRRYRGAGLFFLLIGGIAGAAQADRVLEGLDVLVARRGIAPVDMVWLETVTVVSQSPSYLNAADRRVDPGVANEVPRGSTLVVRGTPMRRGRQLVLSDGQKEVAFADDGERGVVARFTLHRNSELHVAARFGDVLIREPSPLTVNAAPDRAPEVTLEGAPKTIELKAVETQELRYTVRDDHGLRQVDLVLRSGGKEERRVLEKLDGRTGSVRGAQSLGQGDRFLSRMFLPVLVAIEAKDDDPFQGAKWGRSEAITIVPPPVGAVEAERYAELRAARNAVVDLLAWLMSDEEPPSLRQKEYSERTAQASVVLGRVAGRSYPGVRPAPGLRAFLQGQARRLSPKSPLATARAGVEDVVLAVDAGLRAVGTADAKTVAERLGDVAEEAAQGFEQARETENMKAGVERARAALGVLDVGAKNLLVLDDLGQDLGSVTEGELRRIRRAEAAKSLLHAELAARHLAARLRRPSPSFTSAGGGVEGGEQSVASGPRERASDADRRFQEMANDLNELVQEHGALIEQVERDLADAASEAGNEDLEREAAERAQALRRALDDLPGAQQREGSARAAAALAREHGRAMADRLERLDLEQAVESGRTARGLLEETRRKAAQPASAADLLDESAVDRSSAALAEQLAWAERAREQARRAAEERARTRLGEAGERERSIEKRLGDLESRGENGDSSLPREMLERMSQARSTMREASSELSQGRGERGLDKQREAQRLLEQANPMTEPESGRGRESEGSGDTEGGRSPEGHAGVPKADDKRRAEDFRRRVLEGLGKEQGGRLSPAIRRYVEGLLR